MAEADRVEEHRRHEPPTSPDRQRRRSSARPSTGGARGRVRMLYFSLAALWGFLAGTGAVLVGLTAVGRPARLGPLGVAVVLGAAIAAVAGGFVAAAAYRAASRRLR